MAFIVLRIVHHSLPLETKVTTQPWAPGRYFVTTLLRGAVLFDKHFDSSKEARKQAEHYQSYWTEQLMHVFELGLQSAQPLEFS